MQTILGTPYTPPTPDELEALMRQAHRERAQAIRDALGSLFGWRHATKAEPQVTYASLRPSL
jgi:hypothetical protein